MAWARFSILTMMKDEGPRILEWLAYHRLIGFDQVWVYTNDCRDGSDAMLDRLAAMGLCHHLPNVVPEGKKPQPHALTLGQKNRALLDTDWLLVLDADEFLHVKTGDGTVEALIEALPDGAEGVAINWRMMGSNGIVDWSPDPLLPQFTRGAPDGFRRGWGVKTLFKPFPDIKLGIHRPSLKGARRDPEIMARQLAMHWVNGDGVQMPPHFMTKGWRTSAATVGYTLAEVAHFAVQSQEAYLLRGDRGNVNLKQGKYDASYFAMFDRNEVDAPGLAAWSGRVAEVVREWLIDPDLARLQDESVAWHRARRDELAAAPGWQAALGALQRGADTPYETLDEMLFYQPIPPKGRALMQDMLAKGVPKPQMDRMMRQAIAKAEAEFDKKEATELRAMGLVPAFER